MATRPPVDDPVARRADAPDLDPVEHSALDRDEGGAPRPREQVLGPSQISQSLLPDGGREDHWPCRRARRQVASQVHEGRDAHRVVADAGTDEAAPLGVLDDLDRLLGPEHRVEVSRKDDRLAVIAAGRAGHVPDFV